MARNIILLQCWDCTCINFNCFQLQVYCFLRSAARTTCLPVCECLALPICRILTTGERHFMVWLHYTFKLKYQIRCKSDCICFYNILRSLILSFEVGYACESSTSALSLLLFSSYIFPLTNQINLPSIGNFLKCPSSLNCLLAPLNTLTFGLPAST